LPICRIQALAFAWHHGGKVRVLCHSALMPVLYSCIISWQSLCTAFCGFFLFSIVGKYQIIYMSSCVFVQVSEITGIVSQNLQFAKVCAFLLFYAVNFAAHFVGLMSLQQFTIMTDLQNRIVLGLQAVQPSLT